MERIAGSKSDLVRVGLPQGCPFSPILLITFRDRISRRSQGVEVVRFGDFRIRSLLFADDVVLLAPSVCDLQLLLHLFAAVSRMKISTPNSDATVLAKRWSEFTGSRRIFCPKRSSSTSSSCSQVRGK